MNSSPCNIQITIPLEKYPDLIGIQDIMEIFNISEKAAYKLLKQNKLNYIKVGRSYKVPKIFLLEYIGLIKFRN